MASAGSNMFYARPVYLGSDREKLQKSATRDGGQRDTVRQKVTRFSDIDNMDPPPRPPPPRPSRVPKNTENGIMSSDKKRQLPLTPSASHEPKPLTRLNVTSHDKLWQKDYDSEHKGPSDVLSPPLRYITPQTTEELMRNFDPSDLIDSTSEHSDSSADTMIMMTTEEEKKNQQRIDHSLKQYTALKNKSESSDTNKSKTKKNLHTHFSDTVNMVNGLDNGVVSNGPLNDEVVYSKVLPLRIRTDHSGNSHDTSPVVTKNSSSHGSPNDSPDDGYGTNSSSGTLGSPFSSSFGSSDFENSYNGNSKKVILPNGAIKPNSVRESWAVKRKQRMIEATDNTVQDQLRELTIIEEEHSGGVNHANRNAGRNTLDKNVLNRENLKTNEKAVEKNGNLHYSDAKVRMNPSAEPSFINVSSNDLRRVNRQLYVVDSDKNSNPSVERRRERILPQTPSANEINASAPPIPPHLTPNSANNNSRSGNRSSDYRNTEVQNTNTWEVESESSVSESVNSGPLLLGGGLDQRIRTASGSGKIYVSPSGDEGFYSLNRSSRSTSVSSFQPINEVSETMLEQESAQQSPLEVLNGDFLEKWSEMDLNYRNYYGFDDQVEKYSRTDSKVNYFQEKNINNIYGQDNYYRPHTYGSESAIGQGQSSSQGLTNQGNQRDSRDKNGTALTGRSSSQRSHKSVKEKEKDSSKSKFFQILPNMFKPSGKKQNTDSKESKSNKSKQKQGPVDTSVQQEQKSSTFQYEQEAEYMNMGDLPQYCLATIEYEEKLKKGQYVSLESLRKRPVFASSRDIKKLFSTHDQSFDSIQSPGTQRHSFHAMPLSYRHQAAMNQSGDDVRPRAASMSATMRSQQIRNSVESRMALISSKNAAVMQQAGSGLKQKSSTDGNQSVHSDSSGQQMLGSRLRLDSSSSGGDSKLSTLV